MQKAKKSNGVTSTSSVYDHLIQGTRHRKSRIQGRTLEEEADADRGRALFCPAFRRLQNKAQVFSLERNAAIRSRLTHSIEVSSVGRYVAQQAIKAFPQADLDRLGISGKERTLITLVETACLLHDVGNPPFGHFGENAISDWFHVQAKALQPTDIAGTALDMWHDYFKDFVHFDGNPQGFRIATKLQAKEAGDLCGMNLTATTLASFLKYPWPAGQIGTQGSRSKAGYYLTEEPIAKWIWQTMQLPEHCRHPLVYLMEAADDIAYCLSDIEDGIEKGLITAPEVGNDIGKALEDLRTDDVHGEDGADLTEMWCALTDLCGLTRHGHPATVRRYSGMEDFRASLLRYLARHAGTRFYQSHADMLQGTGQPLLRAGNAEKLLSAVRAFAECKLYTSRIVRDRELTAHAVLSGLLNAYLSLMTCDRDRFERALKGDGQDRRGRRITGEQSLISRLPEKCMAVYKEEVRLSDAQFSKDQGITTALERIHRLRVIVDYISGMTDDYALQVFRLVSGIDINRQGN